MDDLANIRPWVEASIRTDVDIPPEHAAVLLGEIDRLAAVEHAARAVSRHSVRSATRTATHGYCRVRDTAIEQLDTALAAPPRPYRSPED